MKRFRKSNIFNSIKIILIALVFIELIVVINHGALTENPVRMSVKGGTTTLS